MKIIKGFLPIPSQAILHMWKHLKILGFRSENTHSGSKKFKSLKTSSLMTNRRHFQSARVNREGTTLDPEIDRIVAIDRFAIG